MSRRLRPIVIWLISAVGFVVAVAAFAVILIATRPANEGGTAAGSAAGAGSGSLSPASSPWLVSIAPGQIAMPENADCGACHVTAGGVVGVKAVPVIAHPIHGWTACTSCHASDKLVATAPGHSGIHANECLVCHRESTEPAPKPKHPTLPDSDCLACHGPLVPLPSNMADRPKELCWLCHHS
jgi:hypothetical protein